MNAAVGLLQKYCGVAVGLNQKNLKDMTKDEWATFFTLYIQKAVHINSSALQVTIHGMVTRQQRQM